MRHTSMSTAVGWQGKVGASDEGRRRERARAAVGFESYTGGGVGEGDVRGGCDRVVETAIECVHRRRQGQ